jgi:cytochrome c551/c552
MKASVSASALALLLVMGQAVALDESVLAQESGCFACHRGAAKWLGPSTLPIAVT